MSEPNNGNPKKTIEERLEAIAQSVELLAHMQVASEKRIDKLAGFTAEMKATTGQIMATLERIAAIQLTTDTHVNALARVAEEHRHRIERLEGGPA